MFAKLKTWLANLLISDYVGSFIRTGIAVLCGFLLKQGITDAEQAAALSALLVAIWKPLFLWLVAQVTSLLNKKTT
jgi:hypothetical protein